MADQSGLDGVENVGGGSQEAAATAGGVGGVVGLFTLGGTIAMNGPRPDEGAEGGDGGGAGVVARLSGAELAAGVPGLAETGLRLVIEDVDRAPSASLTFAQVLDVVREAGEMVAGRGALGAVVTQGTDTLEETAYLADLVWAHQAPLVFTGAMRNPTQAGADGPANLLAAVRAAASPVVRGLGALVAFNDELHAARWVRKTHAASTATFVSSNAGPIGRFEEERVRVLSLPPRRTALPLPDAGSLERAQVALYTLVLDDDARHLGWIAAAEPAYAGVVVAAFGVGHVPARIVPVLESLAARMPVVLVSRTGSGPVLRHTYGAPGAEQDLQRRGLIDGGQLDAFKARVLLRVLLANGAGREQVAAAFAEHG